MLVRYISLALLALLVPLQARALSRDCPYGVNAHQASDEALEMAAEAGIG